MKSSARAATGWCVRGQGKCFASGDRQAGWWVMKVGAEWERGSR